MENTILVSGAADNKEGGFIYLRTSMCYTKFNRNFEILELIEIINQII
jgi:hypothetical protein